MKKPNFYTEDPNGFKSSVFVWSRRNFPRSIKHRDRKRAHRRGQCWKQNKCRPFIYKIYQQTLKLTTGKKVQKSFITLTQAANKLSEALNATTISTQELNETLHKFANQP